MAFVAVTILATVFFLVRARMEDERARARRAGCIRIIGARFASTSTRGTHIGGIVCDEILADDVLAALTLPPSGDWRFLQLEGVQRLPAADVLELLAVRRALVRASPESCAALATGDRAAG